MSDQPHSQLAARSLNALTWGASGALLRLLLQLAALVVLARLLGPQQYGLFAIGAIVVGFSGLFADIGLAYGLIQKPDVSDRDLRFVFTWQWLLGGAVTAVVYFGAGSLAAFFGEPRAAPVLQGLSPLCLLNALAAPSLNLLKRDLDFKRIQLAQAFSYALGYWVLGIPLALMGAQVWALVLAWTVQAAVNLGLLYRATGHPLRPLFWHAQARAQWTYGLAVLGSNLVNWVINNVDRVIVGHSFGSREVGLYATAGNLLYSPTAAALGVVQPVFFAASSRLADDTARIARGYQALLGFVAAGVLPLALAVAIAAEPLVLLLFGPAWQAAAAICTPLALAMPLIMLWGVSTPLLWTAAKPAREFTLQLPLAMLWAGVCWLAARESMLAVAWGVLGLSAVRCALVIAAAVRLQRVALADVWAGLSGGAVLSAAVAAAVLLAELAGLAQLPAWRCAIAAITAIATWAIVVRLWPAALSPALRLWLGRALVAGPWPIRAALRGLRLGDQPAIAARDRR